MGIFRKKLKVGQVWTSKSENPFEQSEFVTEILDIKDGHVLTQSRWKDSALDLPDPAEGSETISMFRVCYNELVKDVV